MLHFLQSPYHLSSGYYGYPSIRPTRQDPQVHVRERERAEALAARRARRAQYLPPDDVDSGEEDLYGSPSERERRYLEAKRRQEALETERRRRETDFRRQMGQATEKERKQTYQRIPNQPAQKRSVPINTPQSPPRKANNVTPPQTPIPPVVEYTQEHHDAAERIQKWYQRYRAQKTINDVAAQFEQAKSELVFPDSLDFVDPDMPEDVITIPVTLALEAAASDAATEAVDNRPVAPPTTEQSSEDTVTESTDDHDVETISSSSEESWSSQPDPSSESSAPRLAYTKRNYPIHAYMEKLNLLLMKLDSVQSYGSRKVRERRKEVARMIEKEAARIESVWKGVEGLGEGDSAAVIVMDA